MRFWLVAASTALLFFPALAGAQGIEKNICPRPLRGSPVPEPEDLRSENGVLKVELTYANFRDGRGQMRYCYRDGNGSQAPTLRVRPGDRLIVTLKNDLSEPTDRAQANTKAMRMPAGAGCANGTTTNGTMDGLATNLHFHGLSVPPVCHQDDVLNTFVAPAGPAFEYLMQIPPDQPPGVYWYHPHLHGVSNVQVQGGASGALIVEGIERAYPEVAGLPERVLIIRDQELITPDAAPAASLVMPEMPPLRDPDGDILNTGTGGGKPAKDLSVNFVAVPYPDYPPALIMMKPAQRELWRVLNASALTYLDLRVTFNGVPQSMGVISLDGVPLNYAGVASARGVNAADAGNAANGADQILWKKQIDLPPGGRVDLILQGPPEGVYGNLVTHDVDTGPAGENDPIRPLANIIAKAGTVAPRSRLPSAATPLPPHTLAWVGDVKPVRERKLYFTEKPSDPKNPTSPTVFMLTVEGQDAVPYNPNSTAPNIVVQQGDVEDWIIENRTTELHDFHIHQIHFVELESNGSAVHEPFLRDTVNVGYWTGGAAPYPSVKLRMDFRSSSIVGTFVYHCHLLEHEDGGMMGTIRVEAAGLPKNKSNSEH